MIFPIEWTFAVYTTFSGMTINHMWICLPFDNVECEWPNFQQTSVLKFEMIRTHEKSMDDIKEHLK